MIEMMSLPMPRARNLYFYEQVEQDTVRKLAEEINAINESDEQLKRLYDVYELTYTPKPIKIHIDSYGGSAYQVLGLMSVMENSKTPIHTYAVGCAMSCGFMMLIMGSRRFAHKYSTPLYHQVSNWAFGTLEEMKEKLVETKRLQKLLESVIVQKTLITKAKMKEVNTKKLDWYMTPKEALEWGVVDEIV